jgi:hypothetical protein
MSVLTKSTAKVGISLPSRLRIERIKMAYRLVTARAEVLLGSFCVLGMFLGSMYWSRVRSRGSKLLI